MKRVIFAGTASILAALTAACAEPPVKPIPDSARQSVTSVSADVSGVKNSDTSKLGARGSDEGGRLGALQGAATVMGNTGGGSLLGVVLAPVGAAVGGEKGASEARSVEVVDETRSNLRLAMQETDFTELLRQRLSGAQAGTVTFTTVTAGPASAATPSIPAGHVIALEYRVNLLSEYLVNPLIGVHVQVTAQVQSADRKALVHTATWTYCGDRADFVQVGANNAAALRAQIAQAATVLGEAIPYDLYASRQPRALKMQKLGAVQAYATCMDFSDLPSRTGRSPVILPPSPTTAPSAAAPAAASPIVPVAATSSPAPSTALDGAWRLDMQLANGTTTGGQCPLTHSIPLTVTNQVATGDWGKLTLAAGEVTGWMNVPPQAAATMPFFVQMAGEPADGGFKGTVTGRCAGHFTLTKR